MKNGACGVKMKQLPFMGIVGSVMFFVAYRTTNYQFLHTEIDEKLDTFYASKDIGASSNSLDGLPHGIIQAMSDLELKPLWSTHNSRSKVTVSSSHNLLAIAAGIKQKRNVDAIAQKFLSENFTIMLFHYDANVDGWLDLAWSKKAIHIVAQNQTKWWFAKRFMHPSVVAIYDYIFLWDEDLGVQNFHPGRYLEIVKAGGLEISQPALDPNSTGIHHKITVRKRKYKFHRRVWVDRGSTKCSEDSEGPPCTGFVEGMAPVFSRSAWHCAWHLIQNDLVHGWGMDMKLGYCAQGDRTTNVGVVDSEYVVHQGIQTLGGIQTPGVASAQKGDRTTNVGVVDSEYVVHQGIQTLGGIQTPGVASAQKSSNPGRLIKKPTVDVRAEIRRQSTLELQQFKDRWEQAVKEDKNWIDPFAKKRKRNQ